LTKTTFYTPLKLNVQAESFSTKHINNIQKINVLLKEGLFSFCTIDLNNEVTLLRAYQLPKNHIDHFSELMEHLLETDLVLQKHHQNEGKLTFAYFDPNYSLVPNTFFDEKEMSVYYQKDSNKKITDNEQLLYNRVDALDHFNVFCIPKTIYKSVNDVFNVSFKSITTSLLSSFIEISKSSDHNLVIANVGNHLMDVAVIKNQSVSFNNSFEYNTPEDFLYYLSNTAQREGLNPKTDKLLLMGNIYKSGGLYLLLRKYFNQIDFGERSDKHKNNNLLTNVASHLYYELFTL